MPTTELPDWFADLELARGAHDTRTDGVCAMEAVAWLAGEPHSDHPECVSPPLGAFLRAWNDALDDEARQVLKPYLPAVIGTAGDGLDEARAWTALDWLVRTHTPAWLRMAGLTDHADTLEHLPPLDAQTTPGVLPALRAVRADAAAAGDAAWDAAGAAAGDAAWAAAWAAAGAAARGAAWAAAWGALQPTVEHLQLSALGLLERLVDPTKETT